MQTIGGVAVSNRSWCEQQEELGRTIGVGVNNRSWYK